MTQAQVINLLLAALPDPQHVRDFDLKRADESVYFTYSRIRFKVDLNLRADEVEGALLRGSTAASLLSQLLKKQDQIENANDKSARPAAARG